MPVAQFILETGQKHKYTSPAGIDYLISCNFFKDHDHKNFPLYYYSGKEKPENIVIAVENIAVGAYPPRYAGIVEGSWTVMRSELVIFCDRSGDAEVLISIELNA